NGVSSSGRIAAASSSASTASSQRAVSVFQPCSVTVSAVSWPRASQPMRMWYMPRAVCHSGSPSLAARSNGVVGPSSISGASAMAKRKAAMTAKQLLDRAQDAYDAEDDATALKLANQAVAADSKLGAAWALVGYCELARDRPTPALAALDRAAKLAPKLADVQ